MGKPVAGGAGKLFEATIKKDRNAEGRREETGCVYGAGARK
jgi:hypothetical protein